MERTTETHYDAAVAGRKRHEPGTFPAELRRLIDALGMTQHEAGNLLDLQPRTVARYLSGDSVPHPATQSGLLGVLQAELKKRSKRKPPPA